jgi:hypothetical protein
MIGYLDTYRSPLPKKKVFEMLYPGERHTARNGRDAMENTRKLEALFWSGIFQIFSGEF